MTEYFKGLFKPSLDKWREGDRKSTKNFIQTYISNPQVPPEVKEKLSDALNLKLEDD